MTRSGHETDYGEHAYIAYAEYVGGLSVHGEPLPKFEDQAPRIQNAWRVAAAAAMGAAADTATDQAVP